MNKEKQRIAIAEACGWRIVKNYGNGGLYGYPARAPSYDVAELPPGSVPNYPTDLNAMREAEKTLTEQQRIKFCSELYAMAGPEQSVWSFDLIHAPAAQRAEAFLRAIGKWKEE